jgi:hypothetical protein
MRSEKGFISLPVLITIIAILALCVAGYVWMQQKATQSSAVETEFTSYPISDLHNDTDTNSIDAKDNPSYSNDMRAVNYKGVLIPEADPKTFVAADQYSSLDSRIDAYDQNRMYKEGKVVFARLLPETDPYKVIDIYKGLDDKVYVVKFGGIQGPQELQLMSEVDANSLRIVVPLASVPSNDPEGGSRVAYLIDNYNKYIYEESFSEGSSGASLRIIPQD